MASKKLNNIYIKDAFSLAGPVEKKGCIKDYDIVLDDYYFGEKTFEQSEIKMQKTVIDNLLSKEKLIHSDVDLLIGGDLSNQISVQVMQQVTLIFHFMVFIPLVLHLFKH